MALTLLPDAERLVSSVLRAQPELSTILGDRIYTTVPASKQFPMARVVRVGGPPEATAEGALWADTPALQVDAWADSKGAVWALARTLQAALSERLPGQHTDLEAVVSSVELGSVQYLPDESMTPAKPRVRFTARLTIKPRRLTP